LITGSSIQTANSDFITTLYSKIQPSSESCETKKLIKCVTTQRKSLHIEIQQTSQNLQEMHWVRY